jgi:UDP-N-acetylglucosamine 2-epimerase (non-hydrolysing)
MVIVQGDTTSALGAAISGFHHKVPVAHIEAGLRTKNKYSPFPEEMNRVIIDEISDLLFPPTEKAALNIMDNSSKVIRVTGNTVVDALEIIRERLNFQYTSIKLRRMGIIPKTPIVLLTVHRRENFDRVDHICKAVIKLIEAHPKIIFMWPLHPNPVIKEAVMNNGIMENKRVFTTIPHRYEAFLKLINDSVTLILTDSGGIQEEAPSFHIPVLVLRNETERPEVIEAGAAKLVGTKKDRIFEETLRLLENPEIYKKMANVKNPYGDGKAAQRIISKIIEY